MHFFLYIIKKLWYNRSIKWKRKEIMGMSNYVMDCEEQFEDAVLARIEECESPDALNWKLVEDKCFVNIMHLSGPEQDELVYNLWDEYWSSKADPALAAEEGW